MFLVEFFFACQIYSETPANIDLLNFFICGKSIILLFFFLCTGLSHITFLNFGKIFYKTITLDKATLRTQIM